MNDLIIDPQIRTWVFLPLVLVAFFACVLRHNLQILLKPEKSQIYLKKIMKSQTLIRSQLLRKNGCYLSETSFNARKAVFINEHTSMLQENEQQGSQLFDNLAETSWDMKGLVLGGVINTIPTIVISSWCMYTFSGFLLTKIPFPLNVRFKAMLQRDIDLRNLSPEWVSSVSWYFLNLFGMQRFYYTILGDSYLGNEKLIENAEDLPPNTNSLFESEIEALIIHEHNCCINNEID